MSRIAGRNGRVYMGIASSAATAEPLAYVSKWGIEFIPEMLDVTAMGDDNDVYLGGQVAVGGDMSGFFDDATAQTYTAALDGQPRKFYQYPNTANTGQYWFGTVIPDFKVSAEVKGAVTFESTWKPGSKIAKVG